jgi:hypothetical protein
MIIELLGFSTLDGNLIWFFVFFSEWISNRMPSSDEKNTKAKQKKKFLFNQSFISISVLWNKKINAKWKENCLCYVVGCPSSEREESFFDGHDGKM